MLDKTLSLASLDEVVFVHIPQLNTGSVAKITDKEQTPKDLQEKLKDLDTFIRGINERRDKKKSD